MTQKEIDLLLKDLCARLPYGVKVENTSFSEPQIHTLFGRVSDDEFLMLETYKSVGGEDYRRVINDIHYTGYLENIKPYLRPMSSMTEEECRELEKIQEKYFGRALDKQIEECFSSSNKDESRILEYFASSKVVDYLNSKHFDYRGLIPIGLALEALEGMYK